MTTQRLEESIRELDKRLGLLENWRVQQEVAFARADENRKFTEERFDRLEKRLDRIDGHIRNIVWLIISAIIGGFITFVLNGGLKLAS